MISFLLAVSVGTAGAGAAGACEPWAPWAGATGASIVPRTWIYCSSTGALTVNVFNPVTATNGTLPVMLSGSGALVTGI